MSYNVVKWCFFHIFNNSKESFVKDDYCEFNLLKYSYLYYAIKW